MPLERKVTEEMRYIEVLKSRHARYIDGTRIVDMAAVAEDYVPPGGAFGKITSNGKYGPVTRDKVDTGGADSANNEIPLKNLNESDWHNWQAGDEIIVDPGETNEETATIQDVDEANGKLVVDSIATDHAEDVTVQKNDGSSDAEFVCTHLVDVSDEDAMVGGITHGPVYKNRMPNYDEQVAEDLPMISFEV